MNRSLLEGVRIADFTWAWAGPYATTLLAFMGAEVIKIESMKRPDLSRRSTFTTGQKFSGLDQSSVFADLNFNKLSVTLNLSHPKGVALAKQIVDISDVVTENMRPGVMGRLGLDYTALVKIKPDIIMLSSSACGSTGPECHNIGYAATFAALGGISHITGHADGPPVPLTGAIDLRSATTSAFAILAALNFRQRTGQGQYIDLSSQETIDVLIGDVLMDYTMNQRVASRSGNRDATMAPHNCYRCKGEDMWVSIAVANDNEWKSLCQAMGNPKLIKNKMFSSSHSRWENQDELDPLIEQWTINLTPYEVMDTLQKVGVAAIPSFNSDQLLNDPHSNQRDLYSEVEHPVMGKRIVVNPPWKLSATPAQIRHPAPLFGQHNKYVFGDLLEMPKKEIAQLMEEKVIY
ncbi:CaiB/BaiF CoA transferase family protein [Chloroflexota bacterium]